MHLSLAKELLERPVSLNISVLLFNVPSANFRDFQQTQIAKVKLLFRVFAENAFRRMPHEMNHKHWETSFVMNLLSNSTPSQNLCTATHITYLNMLQTNVTNPEEQGDVMAASASRIFKISIVACDAVKDIIK